MRKLKQTIFHKTKGDCLRTCVAIVLNLDLHQVPNFADGEEMSTIAMKKWLYSNGYSVDTFRPSVLVPGGSTMANVQLDPRNVYIAAVPSKRHRDGGMHAIIVRVIEGTVLVEWDVNRDKKTKYKKGRPVTNAVHILYSIGRAFFNREEEEGQEDVGFF